MQVFELHFNTKAKEWLIYDSYIFEPENIYEKRLGNLYIVSELTNALPQQAQFLDHLAFFIKTKYYSLSAHSPAEALRQSLRKANDYLAELVKKNNVSWLGNLHLAILTIKDFNLNFTKIGNIKILLNRGEEILDITRNLEFKNTEPYPLKIFTNIVSGKLAPNDKILILTKDIFEIFTAGNLFQKIATLTSLSRKKIKEILKIKEKELSEASGICLLLSLTEAPKLLESLIFQRKKIAFFLAKFKTFLKIPRISFSKKPLLSQIKKNFCRFKAKPLFSKNLIVILALIFILLIGFFIF